MDLTKLDQKDKIKFGVGIMSIMTDEQLDNILERAMRSLLRAQVDELLLQIKEEIKRRTE